MPNTYNRVKLNLPETPTDEVEGAVVEIDGVTIHRVKDVQVEGGVNHGFTTVTLTFYASVSSA